MNISNGTLNALDFSTDLDRLAKSRDREADDLRAIGLDPEELDLREYFGKSEKLEKKLIDDPTIVPEGYESEVIWEGIGLVDFSFAPHCQSDHPESADMEKVVEFYKQKPHDFPIPERRGSYC